MVVAVSPILIHIVAKLSRFVSMEDSSFYSVLVVGYILLVFRRVFVLVVLGG